MTKIASIFLCLLFLSVPLVGCNDKNETNQPKGNQSTESPLVKNPDEVEKPSKNGQPQSEKPVEQEGKSPQPTNDPAKSPKTTQYGNGKGDVVQVVADPHSIPVLINKQNMLPDTYAPNDLMYTTIPFVFQEKNDKRKLRKEAAVAIAELFAGAKKDGINLLGVSGYRSHSTQVTLFNYYVKKDGYEKARSYSALPGTSEHETGLAIDVTGGDGRCPAQDCFANTPEAQWLQNNVAEYGFIIRYPEGKAHITGYKYEPWHLRYVGPAIATEIMSKGITLEEYYNAIPVNN
jgi:zinc D-Ala-D-Ala carboxypeptidase